MQRKGVERHRQKVFSSITQQLLCTVTPSFGLICLHLLFFIGVPLFLLVPCHLQFAPSKVCPLLRQCGRQGSTHYYSFCAVPTAMCSVKLSCLLRRCRRQGLKLRADSGCHPSLLKQSFSPLGCPQSGRPPARTFPAGSRSDRLRTCPPRSTLVTPFAAASVTPFAAAVKCLQTGMTAWQQHVTCRKFQPQLSSFFQ